MYTIAFIAVCDNRLIDVGRGWFGGGWSDNVAFTRDRRVRVPGGTCGGEEVEFWLRPFAAVPLALPARRSGRFGRGASQKNSPRDDGSAAKGFAARRGKPELAHAHTAACISYERWSAAATTTTTVAAAVAAAA